MNMPEFPQEFVKKHCLKVMEARDWRKHFGLEPDPEDDEAHAECGFVEAGCGLKCENCGKFISPIASSDPADDFVPAIRKYYSDMDKYEAWEKETKHESGAFI